MTCKKYNYYHYLYYHHLDEVQQWLSSLYQSCRYLIVLFFEFRFPLSKPFRIEKAFQDFNVPKYLNCELSTFFLKLMCFNIISLDMFLILNFKPIITWTPFWICENDETKEIRWPITPLPSVHYNIVIIVYISSEVASSDQTPKVYLRVKTQIVEPKLLAR